MVFLLGFILPVFVKACCFCAFEFVLDCIIINKDIIFFTNNIMLTTGITNKKRNLNQTVMPKKKN